MCAYALQRRALSISDGTNECYLEAVRPKRHPGSAASGKHDVAVGGVIEPPAQPATEVSYTPPPPAKSSSDINLDEL